MFNNIKIDKFLILLVGILIVIAAMLIFTFRGVFSAMSIAFDVGQVDTESELKINVGKLEEAKNYTLGQKTIVPLNIKDSPRPVVSATPNPAR